MKLNQISSTKMKNKNNYTNLDGSKICHSNRLRDAWFTVRGLCVWVWSGVWFGLLLVLEVLPSWGVIWEVCGLGKGGGLGSSAWPPHFSNGAVPPLGVVFFVTTEREQQLKILFSETYLQI